MQRVVVDSDIVIDFTRKANPLFRTLIELSAQKKIKLFIPSVVVAELVAGQETKDQEKLKDLELLLGKLEFAILDYDLSKKTGELLRDYQSLGLGDAIIAATCLSFDAKLATRNKKDFASIDGLRFFKR